jgi:2,3-bisphosphoglycerate-independent phosphoglycerate mutase
MKYLIVLVDGAADVKLAELGGKTPLQAARLTNTNKIAQLGQIGLVNTIPAGMSPGSDTANLSVLGYDPAVYHTGRSPLEAVSMGIDLAESDACFRCNLVTLTDEEADYPAKHIIDHSAGDITSAEAAVLIQAVDTAFGTESIHFYPGVSYRHAMIVKNGSVDFDLTPPHDVLGQQIGAYLPKGPDSGFIEDMMVGSYDLLSVHPVNLDRISRGLNPANSIWIWGQGRKPKLSSFFEKYHVNGVAISAVDLIKGIALCAGLESIDVAGATGTLHTNFEGKAAAAIKALQDGKDFVYIHVEAPDECSHQGDLSGKIKSVELIDEKIVGPLYEYLANTEEDFKILVLPDHPTPIAIRTHTALPVPFVLFDSTKHLYNGENEFSEVAAEKGLYFNNGYELTDYFFGV